MKKKLKTRCIIIVWTFICQIITLVLPGNAFGQLLNFSLEKALTRDFPKYAHKEGRWVFYHEKANIKKIDDKPLVMARIPEYNMYQVNLTKYLGYHVYNSVCLVLFDSANSKTRLIEPLWYGGCSKPLLEFFIGQKFDNKDALLSFLQELNDLMQIGSFHKFTLTSWSDSLVTYDLRYSYGDTYTTGGSGTTSTVRHNSDGIWRNIRIDIKDLTIIQYAEINPITGEVIKTKL
jgi:hypothetical protein